MHEFKIDSWFIEKAKRSRDGRLNAYETVLPSKTALVIVDMQEYYVADGMPFSAVMAQTIVPNLNRLARVVRAAGGLVAWIQTYCPDDWGSMAEALPAVWDKRRSLLDRATGSGYALYSACEVMPTDTIVEKSRYSAFLPYPSPLSKVLESNGVDTILVGGVATSTCCESTARDAVMLNYRTIMIADGNADHTDALHNHTLGKFLVTFGDVQTTEQLINKLQN
ncbi:MAG: cysteine hydrolase [Alphaproteobacteria bacterium]|nr:cysteine hydrolase [Alphaproteobacteria bacterium]